MLERHIERKVIEFGKSLGYLSYKFSNKFVVGLPDRIIINKFGYVFFIEFKTKKGRLSERQKYIKEELQKFNKEVFVIDDVEEGKKLLEEKIYFK